MAAVLRLEIYSKNGEGMEEQGIVGHVIDIRRLSQYTATNDSDNSSDAIVDVVAQHDKGKK